MSKHRQRTPNPERLLTAAADRLDQLLAVPPEVHFGCADRAQLHRLPRTAETLRALAIDRIKLGEMPRHEAVLLLAGMETVQESTEVGPEEAIQDAA